MSPFVRSPLRTAAVCGLLGLIASGITRTPPSAPEPTPPPLPIATPALVTLFGPDSAITSGPDYHRILDAEHWKALYLQHLGDRAAKSPIAWTLVPEVDFSRCMVLAIFRGKSSNSNGEYLVSIDDRASDLLIRFDSRTYQSQRDSLNDQPGGVPVTPFGIFILPRSLKPIVLEENVQGLLAGPPIWKERRRFPAAPNP